MERVTGIGPVSQPWEGRVLPLNYTRLALGLPRKKPLTLGAILAYFSAALVGLLPGQTLFELLAKCLPLGLLGLGSVR